MTPIVTNKKGGVPTLLSDFFNADNFFSSRWFEKEFDQTLPAVNIKETGSEFNIEFAAPGYNKTDFKVNVEQDLLTVTAEKKEEKKQENEQYTRKEFSYNTFSRSFTLPQTANADNIDAKYSDGILKLTIPKKEEAKKQAKKEIKVD